MASTETPTIAAQSNADTLYVDIDDDLLAVDTPCLRALSLLRRRPLSAVSLLFWYLRGRSVARRELGRRVRLEAASLPCRSDTLALIRREKSVGRRLVLVGSDDRRLVESLAAHTGLFNATVVPEAGQSFSAEGRLEAMRDDARAASTGVARPPPAARRKATPMDYLREMRVHQWSKNALIAVPVLPILHIADSNMLLEVLVAIVAFSLVASSIYVVNDLFDLEADRRHPGKRTRPLAAGLITVPAALWLSALLLLTGLALGMALLPWSFTGILLLYLFLTSAYTFKFKERALLDIFSLAMLYMLRILAGSFAIQVPPSFWILCFALFIFTSLALAKRYTELQLLQDHPQAGQWARGYSLGDQGFVLIAGVCSGQVSVLVLSLYLHDPQVANHYANPRAIWILSPLLLYWITRVWLIAYHGRLDDDPIVFALRDWVSRAAVAVIILSFVLAARSPF